MTLIARKTLIKLTPINYIFLILINICRPDMQPNINFYNNHPDIPISSHREMTYPDENKVIFLNR